MKENIGAEKIQRLDGAAGLPQFVGGRVVEAGTKSDPDTAAHRLLTFAAVSGDVPTSDLALILGHSRYREQVVTALRRKHLLTTHSADGLCSYRLTMEGKRYLLAYLPDRCRPYLCPDRPNKSEYRRRLRNQRVCESYILMERAGVEIFPDRKPWPVTKAASPTGPAAFYGASELRRCSPDAAKIKNARFTGALLAAGNAYLTYHTGDAAMKWEPKSEQRAKAYLTFLLGERGQLIHLDDVRGLMIGADMATAGRLLSSDGGPKRAYFWTDGTFRRLPFLPFDEHGALVLEFLRDQELTERLKVVLMSGRRVAAPGALIACDGYDEWDRPLLLAYDCDLQRLSDFMEGLYLHDMRGRIICFDFQAGTLGQWAGDRVELEVIDHMKVKRRFFQPT